MFDEENASDNEITCRVEESFEEKYNITKSFMYSGKVIQHWSSNLTFFYEKMGNIIIPDFIANNLGWIIISPRAQEIFRDLRVSNIQLLPVIIKHKETGKKIEGFKVLNITNHLNALDLNNSDYKEFTAGGKSILSIKMYSLLAEKIEGYD